MRTRLELWNIVDENFDKYFLGGLCRVLLMGYVNYLFNEFEYHLILSELLEHGGSDEYFLGEKGDKKPRKEFIKKMIEKHSK